MAFVSQSPRKADFTQPSGAKNLGPGAYTTELRSLGQSSSLSKKLPPFGTGEDRRLILKKDTTSANTNQVPGPGQYLAHNEFISANYKKEFDDHTSYIVKDNGHLNQRTQQYAFSSPRESSILQVRDTPGPGAYDINFSTFQNQQMKTFSNTTKKGSFGALASPKNALSGFLNLSIPSIPSRYMQPNLDLENDENLTLKEGSTNNNPTYNPLKSLTGNVIMNSKVKMLVNDSSKLGPGCYDVSDNAQINFGISKTKRKEDIFIHKTTLPEVGPGSYEITKQIDRKIYNPTLAREDRSLRKKTKKRNNGSIRDNYDEFDSETDDEDDDDGKKSIVPGPGAYLKEEYINQIGKTIQKPEQYQYFGSSIERFKTTVNTNVGPGQYNIDQYKNERTQHFQQAGSSSFKVVSRVRDDPMISKQKLEIPGPGDYKLENSINFIKDTKMFGKQAFASNIDRFKVREEEVPGPGNYVVPGSMTIRSASQVHASFRSGVKKELVFPMDKNVPGTGIYNPQHHDQFGERKITGGAPNNFSLLVKKNNQNSSFNQTMNKQTPAQLGPGAYGGKKFKFLDVNSKEGSVKDSKVFGIGERFSDGKTDAPGPGAYNELNKWHKKTYNLKFLNVQMSPQPSNTPFVQ